MLQQKIRGQGFFSLFEFYYVGRKGSPLFHRRNYFWATAWRLFAWVHEEPQLFMLTVVDIWLSPLPKVTSLPPPGNIPENTVKKAEKNWFVFSTCWRRNIMFTGGTAWAPPLADSPGGWHSLQKLCETAAQPVILLMNSCPAFPLRNPPSLSSTIPKEGAGCDEELSLTTVCCIFAWIETYTILYCSEGPNMQVYHIHE